MKHSVSVRTVALCCSLSVLTAGALPPPPALPGSWKWVPEFSDEFNAAELDAKKWQAGPAESSGRPPGFNRRENVAVKDGRVELQLKAEKVPEMPAGDRDFTCGRLRSSQRIRYGYFEIRARAADSNGASTFHLDHRGPEHWTGIEVFALSPRQARLGRTLFTKAPVHRYPGLTTPLDHLWEMPLKDDPAAAFHIWSLNWDAATITWFLDGKPLRTLANTHWKTPLRLILETEIRAGGSGLPDRASPPAVFVIDYVRTWQSVAR